MFDTSTHVERTERRTERHRKTHRATDSPSADIAALGVALADPDTQRDTQRHTERHAERSSVAMVDPESSLDGHGDERTVWVGGLASHHSDEEVIPQSIIL